MAGSTLTRGRRAGAMPPTLTAGLLAVLCGIMTLNPVIANMYLPALGQMAADYGTTIAGMQTTLMALLLGVAVGQLVVGALSDALGRRRVVVAGFAVMTAAAVLVALAPSIPAMLVGRVLEGLGSAAGVVVVRAIVADTAAGPRAARAYSLLTSVLGAGPVLASFCGTMLLQLGGWHAILVGMIVASAVYLAAAALGVPETLPPERRAPLRLPAMARSYGRLLRDPAYLGNALTMSFVFAGLTVHVSASSFVAQEVLGADPWGFWLMFTAYALSVFVGGWLNAPLSARLGPRPVLLVELVIALATAIALLVLAAAGALAIPDYLALVVVGCAAVAGSMANATTLTLGRAVGSAGAAAALMGCVQFGLAALCSPIGGLWGSTTAVPMAAGMAACYLLAIGAQLWAASAGARTPR